MGACGTAGDALHDLLNVGKKNKGGDYGSMLSKVKECLKNLGSACGGGKSGGKKEKGGKKGKGGKKNKKELMYFE